MDRVVQYQQRSQVITPQQAAVAWGWDNQPPAPVSKQYLPTAVGAGAGGGPPIAIIWGFEAIAPSPIVRQFLPTEFGGGDNEVTPTAQTPTATSGWEIASPAPVSKQFVPTEFSAGDMELAPVASYPMAWVAAPDLLRRGPLIRPDEQASDFGPKQGTIVSLTPQGWSVAYPDRVRWLGMPASRQQADVAQPQPPYRFPEGWPAVFPAAVKPPKLNGSLDLPVQQVPTAFIGQAWVFASVAPPARTIAESEFEMDGNAPSQPPFVAPQGWPGEYPALTRKPRPLTAVDLPAQQVPTAFVANAWVAQWEPLRKAMPASLQRDNDPVLGVYSSVIITYPDGWRGQDAQPQRRLAAPRQNVDLDVQPFVTPQGWTVGGELPPRAPRGKPADAPLPVAPLTLNAWVAQAELLARPTRARLAHVDLPVPARAQFLAWVSGDAPLRPATAKPATVDLPLPSTTPAASPQGFSAVYPTPIVVRLRFLGAADAGVPRLSLAPSWVPDPVGYLPTRKRLAPASEAPRPPAPITPPTPLGVTALWSYVDYRFRKPWQVNPGNAWDTWRQLARSIISQPTLLGTSTAPTLLGTSTAPVLYGVSTAPQLYGTSTAPTLYGQSTAPNLGGTVS